MSNWMSELQIPLKLNEALCVSCFQVTSKAFAYTGSVHLGPSFIQKEYQETEMVFDGHKLQEEVVTRHRTIAIPAVRKGVICRKCAGSNYSTRTIKHRDGSESWEPVIKLDRSPTQSTTLNPGWSKQDAMSAVEPHVDMLGFIEEEEIDRKCYSKFARTPR